MESAKFETRRLLTEPAVETYINYAKGTLASLRARGGETPPYIRVGKRAIRYDARQLEQWLESRTVNPSQR